MQSSIQTISPLRQRMVEDMRMRKLMPKTRSAYIRAVRKFAKFLGRSPETATDEDLRRFQLHLIDQGTSPITLNATIVGLNFLFEVTLGRPEAMAKMQSVRVPFVGKTTHPSIGDCRQATATQTRPNQAANWPPRPATGLVASAWQYHSPAPAHNPVAAANCHGPRSLLPPQ